MPCSMHHRKLLLDSTIGGCGVTPQGLLNMNSLQKLPELDKSLSTSDTLVSSPFRRPSQMLVIGNLSRDCTKCTCMLTLFFFYSVKLLTFDFYCIWFYIYLFYQLDYRYVMENLFSI